MNPRSETPAATISLDPVPGAPREVLLNLLEQIAGVLKAAGEDPNPADAVAARVRQNAFDIVIVGQYKRGKTTLINALLGADLLPTAVVPQTSIATRIFYGPRAAARVRFLDGRFEEIPVGDLHLYTTEKGNPGNSKAVALAEVEFPGEALRDGTMLTDTPGIGSVFEHNTKAAVEYIPQADAAIFLVNADPPISEAERDFLTSVRPHLAKLFFVQNKIGQVSPAAQEESLAFTRRVMEEAVGEDRVVIYARERQQVSPSKFRDALRAQAMRIIEEAVLAWGGTEEAQLADALKGLLRRFSEQTNALLGRIAADCEALFGVSFDLFLPEEELPADRRFSIADWFVADGIDLALGVVMNVMPRAFVRRRILAEVNRGMAEKLNMQCGRLRYDFVRRIQERVQEFSAAMDAHFARAITSVRDVVERSLSLRRDREEAAAAARAQATGRLAEIEDVESRLATVVNRIEGEGAGASGGDGSGKRVPLQIPRTAEYVRP